MKMVALLSIVVNIYLLHISIVSALQDSSSISSTGVFTTINPIPFASSVATSSRSMLSTSSSVFPSFDKIVIVLARTVQLQGTSSPSDYSSTITCDDPTIVPYVRSNVTADSTLIISATTDCDVTIRAYTYLTIHIDSVTSLVMTSYSYKGYQLKLTSMGNADIKLANIGYDLGEFTFLGNSTVTLSGNIGKLSVINRGKGTVDANNIQTPSVNAILTGTGSLRVKSTANMNISVNGTGTITWCSPNVQMDVTIDPYRKKNILYQC